MRHCFIMLNSSVFLIRQLIIFVLFILNKITITVGLQELCKSNTSVVRQSEGLFLLGSFQGSGLSHNPTSSCVSTTRGEANCEVGSGKEEIESFFTANSSVSFNDNLHPSLIFLYQNPSTPKQGSFFIKWPAGLTGEGRLEPGFYFH